MNSPILAAFGCKNESLYPPSRCSAWCGSSECVSMTKPPSAAAETPAGSVGSIYAAVLNDLDEMQRSHAYAIRRPTLSAAEMAIVTLERELTAAQKELATYKGTEGFLPCAYKDVHKFFECWPGGLDEVEASIAGHKRLIAAAQKELEDAKRLFVERMNDMSQQVDDANRDWRVMQKERDKAIKMLSEQDFDYSRKTNDLIARHAEQLAAERGRREEVAAQVQEWACEKCYFVYPGPPQKGFMCVICPRCEGNTMPHETLKRRQAEARAAELASKIDQLLHKEYYCDAGHEHQGAISADYLKADLRSALASRPAKGRPT